MRWAKSYSIVDHHLVHGGYFRRLSPTALAVYLFFVVVGDRDGKSFYADSTIVEILRLPADVLSRAKAELLGEGLIEVRARFVWVVSLERRPGQDPLSPRGRGTFVPPDRRANGDLEKPSFSALLESLRSGRR